MLHGALAILAILAPVLGKRVPSTWLSCSPWPSCLAPWHLGALTPVLASRAPRPWHLGQFGILLGPLGLLGPLDAGTGQSPSGSPRSPSCSPPWPSSPPGNVGQESGKWRVVVSPVAPSTVL